MRAITFLLLLVVAFEMTRCGEINNSVDNEVTTLNTANTKSVFSLEGMMCEIGCKGLIKEEVSKFSGVADCSIDFEKSKMEVLFDNNETSNEKLKSVIQEGLTKYN